MAKEASRRIGMMGGTFDPIHYGHLVTAEAARAEYDLDEVVFIPAGRPPHKNGRPVTDPEQRLLMTVLATVTNPGFSVSRIEIDRQGYSYTYDTVTQVFADYGGDCELFFITGADAVLEIMTWYRATELLARCNFIAATRPGFNLKDMEVLPKHILERIMFMEVPSLAISSTDIRSRVRQGRPIHYLLPEAVATYIIKEGLYQE